MDDRLQDPAVELVQALRVDVEHRQRLLRHVQRGGPFRPDLGVVADAAQQPVGDSGRAPRAAGDLVDSRLLDVERQDPGRPPHDPGQLVAGIEVEPVGGTEPIAQRRAEQALSGGRADAGKAVQGDARGARADSLAEHRVEDEVLHRRVERLLDDALQAVDLVDEEDVPLGQVHQDRAQRAGVVDGRS